MNERGMGSRFAFWSSGETEEEVARCDNLSDNLPEIRRYFFFLTLSNVCLDWSCYEPISAYKTGIKFW